jgi:ATP-dependent Lon protease
MPIVFTTENIEQFLGPRKFIEDDADHKDHVGISNGLAWTSYGGDIIKIETVLMPGSGKLLLTGHLGDVMKESAQAALAYVRTKSKELGIDEDFFAKNDIHIHVPAGAIPKRRTLSGGHHVRGADLPIDKYPSPQ